MATNKKIGVIIDLVDNFSKQADAALGKVVGRRVQIPLDASKGAGYVNAAKQVNESGGIKKSQLDSILKTQAETSGLISARKRLKGFEDEYSNLIDDQAGLLRQRDTAVRKLAQKQLQINKVQAQMAHQDSIVTSTQALPQTDATRLTISNAKIKKQGYQSRLNGLQGDEKDLSDKKALAQHNLTAQGSAAIAKKRQQLANLAKQERVNVKLQQQALDNVIKANMTTLEKWRERINSFRSLKQSAVNALAVAVIIQKMFQGVAAIANAVKSFDTVVNVDTGNLQTKARDFGKGGQSRSQQFVRAIPVIGDAFKAGQNAGSSIFENTKQDQQLRQNEQKLRQAAARNKHGLQALGAAVSIYAHSYKNAITDHSQQTYKQQAQVIKKLSDERIESIKNLQQSVKSYVLNISRQLSRNNLPQEIASIASQQQGLQQAFKSIDANPLFNRKTNTAADFKMKMDAKLAELTASDTVIETFRDSLKKLPNSTANDNIRIEGDSFVEGIKNINTEIRQALNDAAKGLKTPATQDINGYLKNAFERQVNLTGEFNKKALRLSIERNTSATGFDRTQLQNKINAAKFTPSALGKITDQAQSGLADVQLAFEKAVVGMQDNLDALQAKIDKGGDVQKQINLYKELAQKRNKYFELQQAQIKAIADKKKYQSQQEYKHIASSLENLASKSINYNAGAALQAALKPLTNPQVDALFELNKQTQNTNFKLDELIRVTKNRPGILKP